MSRELAFFPSRACPIKTASMYPIVLLVRPWLRLLIRLALRGELTSWERRSSRECSSIGRMEWCNFSLQMISRNALMIMAGSTRLVFVFFLANCAKWTALIFLTVTTNRNYLTCYVIVKDKIEING